MKNSLPLCSTSTMGKISRKGSLSRKLNMNKFFALGQMTSRYLILGVFIMLTSGIMSQVSITSSVPSNTSPVSVCSDTVTCTIRLGSGAALTGVSMSLNLGAGIRYVPGSIKKISSTNGAFTIAESGITNLSLPTFSVSDLLIGEIDSISYKITANCVAIGSVPSHLITLTHSGGTNTHTTSTYSIVSASLSILPSGWVSQTVTKNVGNTFTRTLVVKNGAGAGRISQFYLDDIHKNDIQVVTTSLGSIVRTGDTSRLVVDTTDIKTVGDNDIYLEANEQITITETIKVLKCPSSGTTINSDIRARWGCDSSYCQSGQDAAQVSIGSGSPRMLDADLDIVVQNYPNSIASPSCGSGYNYGRAYMFYKNSGSEAFPGAGYMKVRNIRIGYAHPFRYSLDSMHIGNQPVFSYMNPAASVTSSRSLGSTNTGPYPDSIPLTIFIDSTYTTDPDGAGTGLEDIDGDGFYDDLAIGESFRMPFRFFQRRCQIDVCNLTSPVSVAGFDFQLNFWDQCGTPMNFITSYPYRYYGGHYNTTNTNFPSAPADMFDGKIDTFVWMPSMNHPKNSRFVCPAGSDTAQIRIYAPVSWGIDLVGIARINGIAMPSRRVGDTIILSVSSTGTNYLNGYPISMPLKLTCGATSPRSADIGFQIRNFCGSCSDCYWLDACYTVSPRLQCPDPTCNTFTTKALDINRITFGFLDPRSTVRATASTPGVRTDRFTETDTLRAISQGKFQGANPVGNFRYRMYYTLPAAGNVFQYVSGTVTVISPVTNSNLTVTCNIPVAPTVTGTGPSYQWDFNFNSLIGAAGCLPAGFQFRDGDSISVNYLIYVPKGQMTSGVYYATAPLIPSLRSYFYAVINSVDSACNSFGEQLYMTRGADFGFGLSRPNNSDKTWNGCVDEDVTMESRQPRTPTGMGHNNFWIGEHRPSQKVLKWTFNLPIGYDIIQSKTIFRPGANGPNSDLTGDGHRIGMVPHSVTGSLSTGLNYTYDFTDSLASELIGGTDGAAYITIYMKGSCLAAPTSFVRGKAYTLKYAYANNPSEFQIDSNVNLAYNVDYQAPTFDVTPITPQSVVATRDTAEWQVRVCNSHAVSGSSNNWISLISPNNGVDAFALKQMVNGVPVVRPLTVYGTGKKWAKLPTGLANSKCDTFIISSSFTSCSSDSLMFNFGWDCDSFPLNPNVYNCIPKTLPLYVDPRKASLNVSIINQPSTNVDLCQSLLYEVEIANAQLGDAKQLRFIFNLPPNGGIDVEAGTSEVKYPASGSNPYTLVPDPVLSGNAYVWNLYQAPAFPSLGSAGLQGTSSSPNDKLRLRFNLKTNSSCSFVSGTKLSFDVSGKNPCGSLAETQSAATTPIVITGTPTATNTYINFIKTGDLFPCAAGDDTLRIKIINLGPAATTAGDSVKVIIPANVSFVTGTYAGIHNAFSTTTPLQRSAGGGKTELIWPMNAGVAVSDSFVFTARVLPTSAMTCSDVLFDVNTYRVFTATCVPSGPTCNLQFITGTGFDTATVRKPNFEISGVTAQSVNNGSIGETVTISNMKVVNKGSNFNSALSGKLYIDYYHDADLSGTVTGGDLLLAVDSASLTINSGDSTTRNFSFNAASTKACPLVASVRGTSCICSPFSIAITDIPLKNAGVDDTICSGISKVIGLSPVLGNTYLWGPNLNLSSTGVADPIYTGVNITNAPISTMYTLTTNRGLCISVDTSFIVVKPRPQGLDISVDKTCLLQNPITFTASSTSPGVTYSWKIDGVSSGTGTSITQAMTSGAHSVEITATAVGGCTAVFTKSFTFYDLNISATPDNPVICINTSTALRANSSNATNFQWYKVNRTTGVRETTMGTAPTQSTGNLTDTTRYRVVVTNGTCTDSADLTVSVISNVVAAKVDTTICPGQPVVLSVPFTFNTANWTNLQNGATSTGLTYAVSPTVTTMFRVVAQTVGPVCTATDTSCM
jgi:hypothetical protein